jgi:hypothetical protein
VLDRITTKLICIDPAVVPRVWPMVKPLIDRAYAEVDAEIPPTLFNDLCGNRALLWLVSNMIEQKVVYAFITELYIRRSGMKVCRLVAGSGERMSDWLHLQSELEQYARAEGCSKIVAEGRTGWSRALSGYSVIRHVIEKDL